VLSGLRSRILAPTIACTLMLALAAPAAADEVGANYHGTFDTAAFACGENSVAAPALDGVWNLNTSGKTAVVTMNVAYDGSHHMSFGMNGGVVTKTSTGVEVAFGTAIATVSGSHFSWSTPVAPCSDSHPYDHVVYSGAVGR
jgi:hypothetical protein